MASERFIFILKFQLSIDAIYSRIMQSFSNSEISENFYNVNEKRTKVIISSLNFDSEPRRREYPIVKLKAQNSTKSNLHSKLKASTLVTLLSPLLSLFFRIAKDQESQLCIRIQLYERDTVLTALFTFALEFQSLRISQLNPSRTASGPTARPWTNDFPGLRRVNIDRG